MRMEWMNGLWFALSLPAIAALYLFKRTYVDTPISSHLLWDRVLKEMEANRPWQKLRNRLLLYIQLLVAALLVFAIMQPFVWTKQTASAHVVFIVDTSASMQAKAGPALSANGGSGSQPSGASRLDEAKKQLLDWMRAEAKGSLITLISAGKEPELLLSRETSKEAVQEAVSKLTPTYGVTAYNEALSLAASLTREEPDAEVRLLTDGQWAEAAGSGTSFGVPVTLMQTGGDEAGNAGVIRFGALPDGNASGTVSAVASVKNWGTREETFDVSIYAAERLVSVKREVFRAGEQKSLYWQGLPESDYYRLSLDINDALAADNVAYAVSTAAKQKSAILLTDGNLFLEKALSLAGVSVIKPQKNGTAFTTTEAAADMIVVDTVNESAVLGTDWDKHLAGMPVWYIGSLPGEAGTGVKPSGEMSVAPHPVMKYLKLQDAHISQLWKPQKALWGEPVANQGDTPVIYAGENEGKRRLLFAFDLHQSDLPLRSEFPVLVHNAVDWLTETAATGLGSAIAGDKLEMSVSARTASARWEAVHAPANDAAAFEQAADRNGGIVSALQNVPKLPGLYRFIESDSEGQTIQTRLLTVQMDAKEMDLTLRQNLEQIVGKPDAAGGLPSTSEIGAENQTGLSDQEKDGQAAGEKERGVTEGRTPYPLLQWVLLLVLAVVLLEWGVYRRGHTI